jgi:hypothetical protein
MIVKCCNPMCEAPFDYREGRLIRISSNLTDEKTTENHSSIQHFWLCGKCADLYEFEYESGINLKIKPDHQELSERNHSYSVSAA